MNKELIKAIVNDEIDKRNFNQLIYNIIFGDKLSSQIELEVRKYSEKIRFDVITSLKILHNDDAKIKELLENIRNNIKKDTNLLIENAKQKSKNDINNHFKNVVNDLTQKEPIRILVDKELETTKNIVYILCFTNILSFSWLIFKEVK